LGAPCGSFSFSPVSSARLLLSVLSLPVWPPWVRSSVSPVGRFSSQDRTNGAPDRLARSLLLLQAALRCFWFAQDVSPV